MAANNTAGGPSTLRLFFALWPDEELRRALAQLGATLKGECGGRATDAGNLHATLAFLGNVPAARLDALVRIAEEIYADSFELRLDAVGYWRHNRIVWAGAADVPGPLAHLTEQLRRALRALPWPVDERPYVPHVTLLREARCAPRQDSVALPAWRIDQFVLVSSTHGEHGVRYIPLQRWPLRATRQAGR